MRFSNFEFSLCFTKVFLCVVYKGNPYQNLTEIRNSKIWDGNIENLEYIFLFLGTNYLLPRLTKFQVDPSIIECVPAMKIRGCKKPTIFLTYCGAHQHYNVHESKPTTPQPVCEQHVGAVTLCCGESVTG